MSSDSTDSSFGANKNPRHFMVLNAIAQEGGSGSEGEGAGSAETETNGGSSEAGETGDMADTRGADFGGIGDF